MSIFRRRSAADDTPSTPDDATDNPSHASSPEPAPYYQPGMPALHDPAPQGSGFVAVAPADDDEAPPYEPPVKPAAAPDPWEVLAGTAPVDSEAPEVEVTDEVEIPQPKHRRGGRNMPLATATGLLLLGLVIAAAWWHPAAFALLAGGFSIAAVLEWRRVMARSDRRIPMIPVVLASAGLMVATWYGGPEGLVVALMVGCAGTVAWRVVDERIENTMADSLASMLTLLWIPFLAAFLVLMELADDGWIRVLIVVLAVVGSDSGGLFAGMLFGKHPMAPRVSPKKTWEGFAGGLFLGTAAATVAAYYLIDGQWWIGAIVGVACVIAGVLGDLGESAVKRDVQIKDMSSAIPGHGGIMDRVDSLLIAAPVAYVVFALLLGTS